MNQIPFRADLKQIKHQARDLLKTARQQDPASLDRFARVAKQPTLTNAQLVIAREYGFSSWTSLATFIKKKEIEKIAAGGHSTLVIPDEAFDVDFVTGHEIERHSGSCRQCGFAYAFQTTTIRGFADFIEAMCPSCGSSLGTFREDLSTTIAVRLVANEKTASGSSPDETDGSSAWMSKALQQIWRAFDCPELKDLDLILRAMAEQAEVNQEDVAVGKLNVLRDEIYLHAFGRPRLF